MKPILALSLLMNFIFCWSQNYSDYIDLDKIKTIVQDNHFDIIKIKEVFLTQNKEQEQLFIVHSGSILYKIALNGALIDSLQLPEKEMRYSNLFSSNFVIHKTNYILFTEDGYFPDWISTGSKIFKKYDKTINEDLKMDMETIKKNKKEQFNFEFKSSNRDIREYYDFLDSKANDFQLIKLAKELYAASEFVVKDYGANGEYYIFATPKEWIKVYFPSDIDYYTLKAIPNQIDMRYSGYNNKYALEKTVPQFYTSKKSHSFEKIKKIKADFRINILSTSTPHFGYWLGNSYYKIPLGKDIAKLKQNTTRKSSISVGVFTVPNSSPASNIYIIENDKYEQYFIIKKTNSNSEKINK